VEESTKKKSTPEGTWFTLRGEEGSKENQKKKPEGTLCGRVGIFERKGPKVQKKKRQNHRGAHMVNKRESPVQKTQT